MRTPPQMLHLTVLLACTAGFCDTTTFVAADKLLSAHITGNLVVLAADLVQHADARAWTKLVSLPVFVAAVLIAPWLVRRAGHPNGLLRAESMLLTGAGLLALGAAWHGRPVAGLLELVALLIVVAMGLQNAFGVLASQEIYGPTTVMTGKLTQVILDSASLLAPSPAGGDKKADLRKQLLILGGFVGGCVAGGVAANAVGLAVVALPGLTLLVVSRRRRVRRAPSVISSL